MSVTKSRKISSWTLIGLLVVTLGIVLAFFLGGKDFDAAGNKVYANTSALLLWADILIIATLAAAVIFAIVGFAQSFQRSPKRALTSLGGLVALVILLVVTYAAGNGDINSLPLLTEEVREQIGDSQFPLKSADMAIISAVILLCLNAVAILWGVIKRALTKTK